MARFRVEQRADGYYVVVDKYNDDKLVFKTDDKRRAEKQRDFLNRGPRYTEGL